MNYVLLLGAGFSNNWGGWLSGEAFEYLLSCEEIDTGLRQLLFEYRNHGGFETALGKLQNTFVQRGSKRPDRQLDALQAAIRRMFADMNAAFEGIHFEFQNDKRYSVASFLCRFDAIFTLNQDLLLERHYLNENVALLSGGKWDGFAIPGMVVDDRHSGPLNNPYLGLLIPKTSETLELPKRLQPYIKVHGSCNWYDSTARDVMVLGTEKIAAIQAHEILSWNNNLLTWCLNKPETRLMVIGYSFRDSHINLAISRGIKNKRVKLFIVDPDGIDVLDENRHGGLISAPSQFAREVWPSVISASRRSLLTTFRDDPVEHAKLTRFFE